MRIVFFLIVALIFTAIFWQGCVDHKLPEPVNCDNDPVSLELVSVVDSNCELQDGSVEVRASGGTGVYTYRLGDRDGQLSSVFLNLSAGLYEVSVDDVNGCSATLEAVVNSQSGLSGSFETTTAGCTSSAGSIVVTPSGGTPPYNFKIGNSAFTTENTFNNLGAGNYTIIIKDVTECEFSQPVRVKSGVSFSATISPIIEINCSISGCHNGTQFPDFRVFKNIHDNAVQIKTLTGNRTMPQEGSLTQAEITLIACWVDDGAPEN